MIKYIDSRFPEKALQQAKELFAEANCVLLATEYVSTMHKMPYICTCGKLAQQHVNGFRKGKRCGFCNRPTYVDQLMARLPFVASYTEEIVYQCKCGGRFYLPHMFSQHKDSFVCPKCDTRGQRKVKNSRHAENSALYAAWRSRVYLLYDNQCVRCSNEERIEAHHIESWAAFPELRYEESNGVVLCLGCHKEFHRLYGNAGSLEELQLFVDAY